MALKYQSGEEYVQHWVDQYDREGIKKLEEARRSGLLGEQQKLWQEEQDKLLGE